MVTKRLLKVVKAKRDDESEIMDLYKACISKMETEGIFQWDEKYYPTREIISDDIKNGTLYKINNSKRIAAVSTFDENRDHAYEDIKWNSCGDKVLIIHRLAVHPDFQNKGYAKILIKSAEDHAVKHKYTSIRFDVYSKNKAALILYKKHDYKIVGTVYFPFRKFAFYCFEKNLI